jgi:hypothetical protein
MDHALNHFVDGAVATESQDQVCSLGDRLFREYPRLSGAACGQ